MLYNENNIVPTTERRLTRREQKDYVQYNKKKSYKLSKRQSGELAPHPRSHNDIPIDTEGQVDTGQILVPKNERKSVLAPHVKRSVESNVLNAKALTIDPLPLKSKQLIEEFKRGSLSSIKNRMVVEEKDGHIAIYPQDDPHWEKLTASVTEPLEATNAERIRLKKLDIANFWGYSKALGNLKRPRTLQNYNLYIRACAFQNKLQLAEAAFNEMRDDYMILPTTSTYTCIISACAKSNDVEKAFQYLNMMTTRDGLEPTVQNYGACINALVRNGQVNEAFEVCEAMRAHNQLTDITIHSDLLVGCINNGEMKRAWDHFEMMRAEYRVDPDPVAFSIMINCAAENDMVERALNLFDEMEHMGMIATEVTFNTLIKALAKSYRDDATKLRVFEIADKMEKYGYQADIYTVNTVLSACAKVGNVERMMKVINMIKHKELKKGEKRVQLDSISYNIMLHGLANNNARNQKAQNQNIITAMALYEQMKSSPATIQITQTTLNSLFSVLTNALRVNRALEFLTTEFDKAGMKPDAITYTQAIEMLAKTKKMDLAEKMMEETIQRGLKPTYNAYKHMIFGHISFGDHASSSKWLAQMFERDGYMMRPSDIKKYKSAVAGSRSKIRQFNDAAEQTKRILNEWK
jgi:pentatricopeptide repeat protein